MTREEIIEKINELSDKLEEQDIEDNLREQTQTFAKAISITYRELVKTGIPEDLAKELVVEIIRRAGE